jgi:hypothetical protein
MAVQRFVLDSTTLNNSGFGLDGGQAFILDTSTLNSTNVLDGGQFLTVATGTSSLGGTSATATATVKHSAITNSSLGGGTNAVVATVVVPAVGFIGLGGLEADAKGNSTKGVFANADLGGLDASASSRDIKSARFDADLGNVVATATAQSTPPEPPPVDDGVGYQQPYRQKPLRKQVKPIEIPIQIEVIPEPAIIVAQGMSWLGGIDCLALGSITFSTLDDDAEVLLLV